MPSKKRNPEDQADLKPSPQYKTFLLVVFLFFASLAMALEGLTSAEKPVSALEVSALIACSAALAQFTN